MVIKLSVNRCALAGPKLVHVRLKPLRLPSLVAEGRTQRTGFAVGGAADQFEHHAVEWLLLHLGQVGEQRLAIRVVPAGGDEFLPHAHVRRLGPRGGASQQDDENQKDAPAVGVAGHVTVPRRDEN